MKTNRYSALHLILVLAFFLPACSVGLALSGKPDPTLSVIRTGASRGEIELQLGEPFAVIQEDGGNCRCLYEYSQGKNPSAGRAIAHGAMDVLTFGLWEVAGTPIEGLKGSKKRLQIVYGPDNKALDIVAAAPAPPPAPTSPPESKE